MVRGSLFSLLPSSPDFVACYGEFGGACAIFLLIVE